MNNKNLYDLIVKRGCERKLLFKKSKGFQKHHIIPKCMNGANNNDNITWLTKKEHIIAHHLLWKINKNTKYSTKLKYAYNLMSNQHIGVGIFNSFYGKKHSEESLKKISNASKQKKCFKDPEYSKLMSKVLKDKHREKLFGFAKNARAVKVEGKIFRSIRYVQNHFNISKYYVQKNIENGIWEYV